MSYSGNDTRLKIRIPNNAIMLNSWKAVFQERRVGPINLIILRRWNASLQGKILENMESLRNDQHLL